jgi:hypothetical protein
MIFGLTFYFRVEDTLVLLDRMQHSSALRPTQRLLETILLGLLRCSLCKEATRRMVLYNEQFGFYPTLDTWHNFLRTYMGLKRFSEAQVVYDRIRMTPKQPDGRPLRDVLMNDTIVTDSLQPTSLTLNHLIHGYL